MPFDTGLAAQNPFTHVSPVPHCVSLIPGIIGGTEGVRRFSEAVPGSDSRPGNPVGLIGHGADIAYMVLYLCSPAARFVTGQVVAVHGGGTVDQLKLDLGKL